MGISNQKVFESRILRKIMNVPVYMQKKSIFFLRVAIKLYIPTLIILAFFLFVSFKTKIPIRIFMKDPAVIADSNALIGSNLNVTLNPLVGAVSNIGILFWCISSSICFFTFFVLKEYSKINNTQLNQLANFLFYSGILTAVLLLDDLFLFHEAIAPELLNISQTVVYVCLAIMTLFWILNFRRVILKTEWFLLFFAFIFFGLSIITDRIIDWFMLYSDYLLGLSKDQMETVEDGAKLFGIMSWFGYFAGLSFNSIKSVMKQR